MTSVLFIPQRAQKLSLPPISGVSLTPHQRVPSLTFFSRASGLLSLTRSSQASWTMFSRTSSPPCNLKFFIFPHVLPAPTRLDVFPSHAVFFCLGFPRDHVSTPPPSFTLVPMVLFARTFNFLPSAPLVLLSIPVSLASTRPLFFKYFFPRLSHRCLTYSLLFQVRIRFSELVLNTRTPGAMLSTSSLCHLVFSSPNVQSMYSVCPITLFFVLLTS